MAVWLRGFGAVASVTLNHLKLLWHLFLFEQGFQRYHRFGHWHTHTHSRLSERNEMNWHLACDSSTNNSVPARTETAESRQMGKALVKSRRESLHWLLMRFTLIGFLQPCAPSFRRIPAPIKYIRLDGSLQIFVWLRVPQLSAIGQHSSAFTFSFIIITTSETTYGRQKCVHENDCWNCSSR